MNCGEYEMMSGKYDWAVDDDIVSFDNKQMFTNILLVERSVNEIWIETWCIKARMIDYLTN